MEMLIDATNLVLGRISSFAARKALLGDNIIILNCEKAVVTGNRDSILEEYRHRRERGSNNYGPFFPRMSDRFVRRTVRGMLPFKKPRGKDAFRKVMCYTGVPEQFRGKKMITIQEADVAKSRDLRFMRVGEICAHLGGRS